MQYYSLLMEKVENQYISNIVSIETVDELFDLIYDKYYNEAEEDHEIHNYKKYQIAKSIDKRPEDLINKKYKKVETGKKADLKYSYDDMVKTGKRSDNYPRIDEKKLPNGKTVGYWRDATTYDLSKIPKSDIEKLKYMKKHADPSNPKEIKKYITVFKMFCNKYGIKEDSTLYIQLEPDVEWGGTITEWKGHKPLKKLDNSPNNKREHDRDQKEVPIKVPKGYSLIHKCRTDGLNNLKPKFYSNKYIGQEQGNPVNGQYNMSGRVYFLLIKDEDANLNNKKISSVGGSGGKQANHIYKLATTAPNVYIDPESSLSHAYNNNPSIENLLKHFGSCSVYVKTTKPLPVKQLV